MIGIFTKVSANYSNLAYDYTFNNMLEGERDFDLKQYIKKWNRPECISNNHKF